MPMRRRSGLSSLSRWIFAISRPSNKMLPSVGSNHPVDAAQHRGFARAGGADDDHQFPPIYVKAHIFHRLGGAIVLFQVCNRQQRAGLCPGGVVLGISQ